MVFRSKVFSFLVIVLGTPVYSNLDSTQTKACEAVSVVQSRCNEDYLLSPDETVCGPDCSVSEKEWFCHIFVCVTSVYGITTNGKIDEAKCRALLKRLTKENPASKPLNDQVEKNCLNGKYKHYVTSDPKCDTMKYHVCAYVNYLMGCQKFNNSPRSCKALSHDVGTCKPVLQQYLKQIKSKRC